MGGQGRYAQLDSSDTVVTRLALQDNIPWHSKPNLRLLYLLMVPACLGVMVTTGQVFAICMFKGEMLKC